MKRATIAIASVALLLCACSSPRKACRRAEGHIQKAVRICPESAQLRTDTVTITVPGDSVAMAVAYPYPDADSLRAVVAQLCEALEAERDAFEVELNGRPLPPQTAKAVKRARQVVCYHAPVAIDGETARGVMWVDSSGTPRGKCWCKPQTGVGTIVTPQVLAGEVTVQGGIPWWMWALCGALAIACIVLYLQMDHWRYKYRFGK